jgi:hypothetical protein
MHSVPDEPCCEQRRTPGRAGLRPQFTKQTPSHGVLVAVDYAERWSLQVLHGLVDDLSVEYDDRVVRVLLLARPQRESWEALRAELGHSSADVPAPLILGEFTTTADETADAYAMAVEAFQSELGQEHHVLAQPAETGMADPLSLHMQALAAVCADVEDIPPPDTGNLSGYLLDHERRYWDCWGSLAESAESLVLVATLFGPFASASEARQWIRWARLADGEAEATKLLEAHHRLYPPLPGTPSGTGAEGEVALLAGGDLMLPPTPGRLAEDFVGNQLAVPARKELVIDVLSVAGQEVDRTGVRRCLDTLAAASRYPHVRRLLFDRLRSRSDWPGSRHRRSSIP